MKNEPDSTNKLARREVLCFGSLAATGLFAMRFQPAMAGPFAAGDFEKLVPSDKKLVATLS